MGVRVLTAGADFLADAPPLERLVLRRRSLAAKERKERKADKSLSLCCLCSFGDREHSSAFQSELVRRLACVEDGNALEGAHGQQVLVP